MSLDQDPDSLLPPRADATPGDPPLTFRRPPKVIVADDESPLAPIGRFIGAVAMIVTLTMVALVFATFYLAWLDYSGPLIGGIWTIAGLLVVIACVLAYRR